MGACRYCYPINAMDTCSAARTLFHSLVPECHHPATMWSASLAARFICCCIALDTWAISVASKQPGHHSNGSFKVKTLHGGQFLLSTSKIKLKELYLTGINAPKGEKGEKGQKGDKGRPGEKGDKGESCSDSCRRSVTFNRQHTALNEPCNDRIEGQLSYDKTSGSLNICSRKQWKPLQTNAPGQINNSPPRKSCLDILFHSESQGDGTYWINPVGKDDSRNSFRAYCDMTTSGGGWTLVAKVTHDYSWACPERVGAMCSGSSTDPLRANLFHDIHQRDTVDMSIKNDSNAGVHLNNTVIRLLFQSGRQSVRLTFVNTENDWTPSEDAYAAFNPSKENVMFIDQQWGEYTADNLDYTWNVIKHTRKTKKFQGKIVCWGNKVKHSYRFYDHGLHVGSPASSHKPCLLDNNENEVMLKSHYAILQDSPFKARWDMAQFGFLGANLIQVPNKRLAIWIR